jgi:hypothetical protein
MADGHITADIETIAAAHRPRWWQRRNAMFEVNYWDDDTTRAALDTAGAGAAAPGNVWAATHTRHPTRPSVHLAPDVAFSEALFKIVQITSGIDAGTLWVDYDAGTFSVRGIEPRGPRRGRTRQQRRRDRLTDRALTVAQRPVTTLGDAPVGSALTLVHALRPYPPHDDSLSDVVDYSRYVESTVAQLDHGGWSDRWDQWRARLGTDADVTAALRLTADDLRARRVTNPWHWTRTGSEVPPAVLDEVVARIDRSVEMIAAAERHHADVAAIRELIGDDVATTRIGDLVAVAYQ